MTSLTTGRGEEEQDSQEHVSVACFVNNSCNLAKMIPSTLSMFYKRHHIRDIVLILERSRDRL